MAFTASKVPSGGSVVTKGVGNTRPQGKIYPTSQGFERRRLRNAHLLMAKLSFPDESLGSIYGKTGGFTVIRGYSMICLSTRTQNSEGTESVKPYADCSGASGAQIAEEEVGHSVMPGRTIHSSQGLVEACRFACNDAKFVNERARNDLVLLSRAVTGLDIHTRSSCFAIFLFPTVA